MPVDHRGPGDKLLPIYLIHKGTLRSPANNEKVPDPSNNRFDSEHEECSSEEVAEGNYNSLYALGRFAGRDIHHEDLPNTFADVPSVKHGT